MTNQEFLEKISEEGEEWRDVVGYEGLFMVSNLGRISAMSRIVKVGNGTKTMPAKLFKLKYTKNGYLYVDLWVNNNRQHVYVHRAIAQAWIDNPNGFTQIDHIDGNKLNNSLNNLRWCTYEVNNNNPITKFRFVLSRRKDKSKSVEIACIKNGMLIKTYLYAVETSKDGFRPECVRNCLNGKQKTHKGCTWMYLSDYEASHQ